MALAQDLYTWLIRPLEGVLTAGQISTLVMVPDGALRALPLAALHDGQQYLIEKYALAVTPSLTLTDPAPLPRDRVRVLAAGVTHEVAGLPALPAVQAELDNLRQRYGGVVLRNQAFSPGRLEQTLQQGAFDIVHIASHGQFAATAAHSFLLTGQGTLTLERFAQMVGRLRVRARPLELLTLSACDTAQGDDQAALGLAGVAIQAGARSALASLWAIADDATAELMRVFYTHLHTPGVSKAQALQRAQQALLQQPRYAEPVFWAPFVVLNNWL
jgi:CHAT domain-containing protein